MDTFRSSIGASRTGPRKEGKTLHAENPPGYVPRDRRRESNIDEKCRLVPLPSKRSCLGLSSVPSRSARPPSLTYPDNSVDNGLFEVKRLAADIDDAAALEEEIGANEAAELEAQVLRPFRQPRDADQRGPEWIFA
jgi:hypothetical protein